MNKTPITLTPIGSPTHCDAVGNAMKQIGYLPYIVRPFDLLEDNPDIAKVLVLLINTENAPDKRLLGFLANRNQSPVFGLVDTNWPRVDSAVLSQCDDFVKWPCEADELAVRMARLSTPQIPPRSNDKMLIEEFVNLNLIGQSQAFVDTLRRIKRFSECDTPVLIEGETGTGKELAARALHYLSGRRNHPFVPVNCGALPDTLIENELFGHAKGAYTDARESRRGLIELGNGGTLFLDEIDSLSAKAQVTLLRFLQDMTYRPLGGEEFRKADVRVIAATNRKLSELVTQREFREDLYYRLNILFISMPPLRERNDDSVLLAQEFMRRYRTSYDQPAKYLRADTLKCIRGHDWPGNVRELENFVHREFLLMDDERKNVSGMQTERRRHLFDRRHKLCYDVNFAQAKATAMTEFEKTYLSWLMAECDGNVTRASRRCGKERRAVGKLLKKYGIKK